MKKIVYLIIAMITLGGFILNAQNTIESDTLRDIGPGSYQIQQ